MKKIMLAIALTAGLFSGAVAGEDSINAHINNTLCLLFKLTDNHYPVNANNYMQTTLDYNGLTIIAFKNKTSNWCGFFKKLSTEDLPANAIATIQSKYKHCILRNAVLYFNNETDITYFAEIIVNNRHLVMEIQPSGQIRIIS